jgi:hypothetical protein
MRTLGSSPLISRGGQGKIYSHMPLGCNVSAPNLARLLALHCHLLASYTKKLLSLTPPSYHACYLRRTPVLLGVAPVPVVMAATP